MKKPIDLTGKIFGRLTVIKLVKRKNDKHRYWLCKCKCGKYSEVRQDALTSNKTHSCGCLIGEVAKKLYTKHNLYQSRIYKIYQGMKMRCYNPKNPRYSVYGKKGIKVCKEWLEDFKTFYNWSINNGYQDDLSIDRINVNGNYEPNNCRWVNQKTQQRNRRNNKLITYNNETHCLFEWAEIYGINPKLLSQRLIRNKMPFENAIKK